MNIAQDTAYEASAFSWRNFLGKIVRLRPEAV